MANRIENILAEGNTFKADLRTKLAYMKRSKLYFFPFILFRYILVRFLFNSLPLYNEF